MNPPENALAAPAQAYSEVGARAQRRSLIPFSLLYIICAPVLVLASEPDPSAAAKTPPAQTAPAAQTSAPQKNAFHFYIQEYRVHGNAHLLTQDEFEHAVYPFLGPYRTSDDVEQARGALEKAYRDKGYPFVTVEIPPQDVRTGRGVVYLQVMKNEVGRLRIHGSRYYSLDEIRREAPSLSEGTVPNFSQVTHDIAVLNELPDRQITPVPRAGITPGTTDIDLNVKDTFPLHGSLELNNRYSTGTTALRLNGSMDYDNLWQLGHTIGASFQIAPEDVSEVKVFSGFYSARIPDVNWLTLIIQGTDQNSNVNTLGGIGVAGTGQTIGARAVITLPSKPNFFHSISLGFDYKHNTQDQMTNDSAESAFAFTPVTYYPISAAYSATWLKKDVGETDLNASVTANMRTISSSEAIFDQNRFGASGNFIYFRGDISHTHELPEGFQAFAKVQGQASGQPLLSNEQISEGGIGTVRGYLESEDLGDNGILTSGELRSPSLGNFLGKSAGKSINEWRVYVFGDWGVVSINEPLPEQQSTFKLASVGGGTRIKTMDHFNGSLDASLPLDQGTYTKAYSPHLTFRLWADF